MFEDHFDSEIVASESHLRYVPVMVTRLLLSLRKASSSRQEGWSLGEPTAPTIQGFVESRDEIPLDTVPSTYRGAHCHIMDVTRDQPRSLAKRGETR